MAEAYQPKIDPDLAARIANGPVNIAILYKCPTISKIDIEADSKTHKDYMNQRAKLLEGKGVGPLEVTDFGMIFLSYQGSIDGLLDGEEVYSIIEKSRLFDNGSI